MSKVKYLYVRDRNNFPRGTFAYKVKEKSDGSYKLSYAYSSFYMLDQYSRSFARDLTCGRLENAPLSLQGSDPEVLLIDALDFVSQEPVNYWNKKRPMLGPQFASACARTARKLESAHDASVTRKAQAA